MRSRLIAVLALFIFAGPTFAPIYASQTTRIAQTKSETVYLTRTGKKFHRDGCRYLSKSRIPVKRSEAVSNGYTACKVCRP